MRLIDRNEWVGNAFQNNFFRTADCFDSACGSSSHLLPQDPPNALASTTASSNNLPYVGIYHFHIHAAAPADTLDVVASSVGDAAQCRHACRKRKRWPLDSEVPGRAYKRPRV